MSLFVLLAAGTGCGLLATAAGEFTRTMNSEPMEPTIEQGARFSARRTAGDYIPRLGDVVVFETPHGWTGMTPDTLHVSRVIGVPGSTVTCCDAQGRLQVNGAALDERYLAAPPASYVRFTIKVPPGRLWVMSDNRHIALDSRSHQADPGQGTIATSDVSGVVDPSRH
ncbi:signal peptidase I [Nonomuraea sp. NPDC002799]